MPVADVSCGQRTRVLHPESSFSKHKFQLLTVHCTCKIISIYSSWSSRMPNIKFSHFPYPFWFVQTKVYFPKQSWLRTQNYSKRGGEEQLKESDIEYINFTFHREEERKNGIKNYPRIAFEVFGSSWKINSSFRPIHPSSNRKRGKISSDSQFLLFHRASTPMPPSRANRISYIRDGDDAHKAIHPRRLPLSRIRFAIRSRGSGRRAIVNRVGWRRKVVGRGGEERVPGRKQKGNKVEFRGRSCAVRCVSWVENEDAQGWWKGDVGRAADVIFFFCSSALFLPSSLLYLISFIPSPPSSHFIASSLSS